jgi:hypothetical protein
VGDNPSNDREMPASGRFRQVDIGYRDRRKFHSLLADLGTGMRFAAQWAQSVGEPRIVTPRSARDPRAFAVPSGRNE